jgi:dTDP-4-amino-4,6-dideoxygalactose transaminase
MNETLALNGGPKAITRTAELAAASRWPVYAEEEQQAVVAAMRSDNVYADTTKFEEEFAAYHGARYALAHCNGSSSIHAAYFAVGVQPGDEVITSPYTWHLQAGQILALHALPVFCDINPRSACIEPEEIRRNITPRTRAIVVVHPFGAVSPMDEIMAIAREHNIPVIEDCSHAHGATYKGQKVGTFGDIGCFSLQASKLMNAIEGGILITNSERYYARACALAHYDYLPKLSLEEYRRFHDPTKEQAPACFGFKYRINPLASAIARVQLSHLDEWNARRRRNMGYLTQRIAEVGRDVLLPPYESPDMVRTWLNYICIYTPERTGVPRETFLKALQAEGLPATGGRQGYLPIYWNPLYEERVGIWGEGDPFDAPWVKEKIEYKRGLCPVTETLWRQCIGLPMLHWETRRELLDEIAYAIEKVVCNLDSLREGAQA